MLEKSVEAVLFLSPEALEISEICRILKARPEEIEMAIEAVARRYREMDSAIEVVKVGNRYLMRVKPEFADIVEKFAERELDRGTMRTLAVIAVRQPITLAKLAKIRGNKCYDHVKKLIELELVKAEKRGRSTVLTTTEAFASYFGFESKDPEEIKEKLKDFLEKND
jgi:segregation and condensation protein B